VRDQVSQPYKTRGKIIFFIQGVPGGMYNTSGECSLC
jgi:hypothetical protein